jgi:hypothetical protein
MIMDSLLFFDGSMSSAGVLTGTSVNSGTTFTTGANTDSANILDVSQIASSASGYGRDVGVGDDPALEVYVSIQTQFTGAGASLQVLLEAAPDSSGSPGNYTILAESQVYAVAALTQGTELFRIKIPAAPVTLVPKFYKLTYVVTGANMTAGAILAGVVLDREALGPGMGYRSGIPSTTLQYM